MTNNAERIAKAVGFKVETKGMTLNQMKNKLYASSPFDLATDEDNAYRDGVDNALEMFQETLYPKA